MISHLAAFTTGAAIALLVSLTLIPDQPEKILIPVPSTEIEHEQPKKLEA